MVCVKHYKRARKEGKLDDLPGEGRARKGQNNKQGADKGTAPQPGNKTPDVEITPEAIASAICSLMLPLSFIVDESLLPVDEKGLPLPHVQQAAVMMQPLLSEYLTAVSTPTMLFIGGVVTLITPALPGLLPIILGEKELRIHRMRRPKGPQPAGKPDVPPPPNGANTVEVPKTDIKQEGATA
jgi:hypothetical protein